MGKGDTEVEIDRGAITESNEEIRPDLISVISRQEGFQILDLCVTTSTVR